MNSWNQQNQTQAYNPYGMATGMQFNARGPIYRADPIHGRPAAEQFPMGAGSEIYLPDADQDLIWWIRTDNFGNKMVKPFKVTPYEEPAPITLEDVMAQPEAISTFEAADVADAGAIHFQTCVQVANNNCNCNLTSSPTILQFMNNGIAVEDAHINVVITKLC